MDFKSLVDHAKKDPKNPYDDPHQYNRPTTPHMYSDMLKPYYDRRNTNLRRSVQVLKTRGNPIFNNQSREERVVSIGPKVAKPLSNDCGLDHDKANSLALLCVKSSQLMAQVGRYQNHNHLCNRDYEAAQNIVMDPQKVDLIKCEHMKRIDNFENSLKQRRSKNENNKRNQSLESQLY